MVVKTGRHWQALAATAAERCERRDGREEEVSLEPLNVLEARFQQWAVPSDVREAVRQAVTVVSGEGATLVEAIVGDQVAVAVRGQPTAVYISPSGVSVALVPTDAARAHRADSAIGLDKESETTWVVHCRYGRLDSSRLNSMTSLMVRALRRYAPKPEPRQPVTRSRRRAASPAGVSGSSPSKTAAVPRTTGRRTEEERQRAVEAAIPRCPVPGCNLPMIGGSCGFHD